MTLVASWQAPDGVVAHGRDGKMYITDTRVGKVYAVNATAALIFERARGGDSLEVLVETLAQQHPDIAREELVADAQNILAQFTQCRLLTMTEEGLTVPSSAVPLP